MNNFLYVIGYFKNISVLLPVLQLISLMTYSRGLKFKDNTSENTSVWHLTLHFMKLTNY